MVNKTCYILHWQSSRVHHCWLTMMQCTLMKTGPIYRNANEVTSVLIHSKLESDLTQCFMLQVKCVLCILCIKNAFSLTLPVVSYYRIHNELFSICFLQVYQHKGSSFTSRLTGSESWGQEEAGLCDERVSYLQVAPL